MENEIFKLSKNGYIFSKDLSENNIPTIYLTRLEKKGKLRKVARGIYILNEYIEDPFYLLSLQYSKLVFTNKTALYLNQLTNRQLENIEAIFPFGTKIENTQIKSYYSRNKIFYELGIDYIMTPYGNKVRCYDKERCICNLFLSNITDEEEKIYVIKEYIDNHLNIKKLYTYSDILGCGERIREIFEILLWD